MYYTYKKLSYKELIITFKNILKLLTNYKKIDSLLLFCCFELISIKVFKKFYNKKTIAFIFINSIAHYQHGFWNCKKATVTINIFLEILMNELNFWDNYSKNNGHIVTALSQENSNTRYVYNFKNPKLFIKKVLKLSYENYEMGMTNEITLLLHKADSTKILKKLKNIKIKMGKKARVKMEKYYDEKIVIKKYINKINEIIS